eukprot:TRINITY_DN17588_c0_g1_i2.p1 TRINITY_DN17588_c0_g1~~TRINITY_DN17588_c0_g1_i2.p1  ORF type:complete len:820 (+),score=163.08 TRINITY_DN17588_c0_g1_i2:351-2810(+)
METKEAESHTLPDAFKGAEEAEDFIDNSGKLRTDYSKRRKVLNAFVGLSRIVRGGNKKVARKHDERLTIPALEHEVYEGRLSLRHGIYELSGPVPRGLLRCHQTVRLDILLLLVVFAGCFTSPACGMWGGGLGRLWLVPGGIVLLAVDFGVDLIYLVLLLLKFNTSCMTKNGRVELVGRSEIRKQLLQAAWFWLMMFTCLGHPLCELFVNPLFLCFKVFRIYHVLKLPESLARLEGSFVFRASRPAVLLFVGSHVLACSFTFVGNYVNRLDNTMYSTRFFSYPVPAGVSVYLQTYCESLHLLTGNLDNPLGEGDSIRQGQFWPLVLILGFAPFGSIILASFLSVIVREQTKLNVLQAHHEEKRAFITKALENLSISPILRRRVFSLIRYQEMSHDYAAFNALFDRRNISAPLEFALRVHLYHESVLNSTYFTKKGSNYVLEVIKVLEDRTFVPGDYVVRRGETGQEMYFIGRGELSVLVPSAVGTHRAIENDVSKAIVVKGLKKGDFFGEVALIQHCQRTAWVMAETYSVLSVLARKNMEPLWTYFPDYQKELQDAVEEVARRDQERKERQSILESLASRLAGESSQETQLSGRKRRVSRKAARRTTKCTVCFDAAPSSVSGGSRPDDEPTESERSEQKSPPRVSRLEGLSGAEDGVSDAEETPKNSGFKVKAVNSELCQFIKPAEGVIEVQRRPDPKVASLDFAPDGDSMQYLAKVVSRLVENQRLIDAKTEEALSRHAYLEEKVNQAVFDVATTPSSRASSTFKGGRGRGRGLAAPPPMRKSATSTSSGGGCGPRCKDNGCELAVPAIEIHGTPSLW